MVALTVSHTRHRSCGCADAQGPRTSTIWTARILPADSPDNGTASVLAAVVSRKIARRTLGRKVGFEPGQHCVNTITARSAALNRIVDAASDGLYVGVKLADAPCRYRSEEAKRAAAFRHQFSQRDTHAPLAVVAKPLIRLVITGG